MCRSTSVTINPPLAASLFVLLTGCVVFSGEGPSGDVLSTQKQIVANVLDTGNAPKALIEVRKLMKDHGDDPEVLNLMGLVQLALKNNEESVPFFEQAYASDDRIPHGLNLSSAYLAVGRLQAAQDLLKGIEKRKDFAAYEFPERVYHNQARVAEAMGTAGRAEELYQKALRANPAFQSSIMRLGGLKEAQGQEATARTYYQRAVQHCPMCLEAVTALAQSYARSGRRQAAGKVVRDYLKQTDMSAEERRRAEVLLSTVGRGTQGG